MPSSSIHKTLRTGILGGVCISVLTVAYSILRYPGIVAAPAASKFLPLFLVAVVWYGVAATRWTRAANGEDLVVLHYGARWGAVIGLVWIVEVFAGDVLLRDSPVGLLAAIVAAVLPVAAGAAGAAVTGQAWTGARIGFWCGVVSGLIAFVALAGAGYLVAYFPEFLSDPEIPPAIGGTAAELATYNIADYLADGVSHLILVGALFCSAAGALGGLFGRVVRSPSAIRLSH